MDDTVRVTGKRCADAGIVGSPGITAQALCLRKVAGMFSKGLFGAFVSCFDDGFDGCF